MLKIKNLLKKFQDHGTRGIQPSPPRLFPLFPLLNPPARRENRIATFDHTEDGNALSDSYIIHYTYILGWAKVTSNHHIGTAPGKTSNFLLNRTYVKFQDIWRTFTHDRQ